MSRAANAYLVIAGLLFMSQVFGPLSSGHVIAIVFFIGLAVWAQSDYEKEKKSRGPTSKGG